MGWQHINLLVKGTPIKEEFRFRMSKAEFFQKFDEQATTEDVIHELEGLLPVGALYLMQRSGDTARIFHISPFTKFKDSSSWDYQATIKGEIKEEADRIIVTFEYGRKNERRKEIRNFLVAMCALVVFLIISISSKGDYSSLKMAIIFPFCITSFLVYIMSLSLRNNIDYFRKNFWLSFRDFYIEKSSSYSSHK